VFNVGILLFQSSAAVPPASAQEIAKGPENPDPYVFYIADARTDLKPAGWSLVNPLAPAQVTQDILSRWTARNGSQPFQLGQTITKEMAPYWEVNLDTTSISQLLQYDLLFITNHKTWGFTPAEREKLRKLLDAGGSVWIEDCGGMRTVANQPFVIEDLQFTGDSVGNGTGAAVYQPNHPLLNTPYKLSYEEISNLGDKNYGNYAQASQSATNPSLVLTAPSPQILTNVVGNLNVKDVNTGLGLPYISAGIYGSGALIVTSGDSGCDINDYAGGTATESGGNSGAIAGPNIMTAHEEDLKFLYNMIDWGSSNNTFRRNNRRTADSSENVGAPLVSDFTVTSESVVSTGAHADTYLKSVTAPLIINSIIYETGINSESGAAELRAYDSIPNESLSGNGNPDDGLVDLSYGAPYDQIWNSGATTMATANGVQPSAPVFADVYFPSPPSGVPLPTAPAIFVTGGDGTLFGFYGAGDPSGVFPMVTPAPNAEIFAVSPTLGDTTEKVYRPNALGAPDTNAAPAPVAFNNLVYVAQPDGSVRCIAPGLASNGNFGVPVWQTFIAPVTSPSALHYTPSGSPTVGYVTQNGNNSFAAASNGTTNDLMLYEPVQVYDSSNTFQGGDILCYWLGTKNEVVPAVAPSGVLPTGMKTRVAGSNSWVQPNTFRVGSPADFPGFPVAGALPAAVVRVYADNDNGDGITAADHYASGAVAPNLTATLDEDGIVIVTGTPPTPLSGSSTVSYIFSCDYYVVYNTSADKSPGFGNLANMSGARQGKPFANTGAIAGYSTLSLDPNDLLLYSYRETTTNGLSSNFLTTIDLVQEQDGPVGSNVSPVRVTLLDHTLTGTINNTTPVTDSPVIRNQLNFANNIANLQSTNTNAALAVTNITPIGAPIVSNNGVAYVLASGQETASLGSAGTPLTVLMAIQTHQAVTLSLPAFDGNQPVQILQLDPHDPTGATTVRVGAGGGVNARVTTSPAEGKITIVNFLDPQTGQGTASPQNLSATQSFVVTYTPAGSTTSSTILLNPLPSFAGNTATTSNTVAGETTTATQQFATSGFSPILWYYVLPGAPTSSPTLSGSVIYYMSGSYLVALDADPGATDPLVQVGAGGQILNVGAGLASGINHVRWAIALDTGAANATAPPVAAEGILAANTQDGMYVFENSPTLIADSRRILEVDGGSGALWSVDSPLETDTVGGELPVANGQGGYLNGIAPTGRTNILRKPFARPAVVRKLDSSDYLIADSGNNRVVRIDRGANILWQLTQFNDPYGLLAPGESTTVKEPTDAEYYLQSIYGTNNAVIGYEVHYIIVDSGNFRIIEVADFYDANGVLLTAQGAVGGSSTFQMPTTGPNGKTLTAAPSGEHVLVWITRTADQQNRNLQYQTVQRVAPNFGGGATPPLLIAVIGNAAAGGTNASVATPDFTGGALSQIAYHPYSVFNNPFDPDPTPWASGATEPVGNGQLGLSFTSFVTTTQGALSTVRITRPTYFQEISIVDPTASSGNTFTYKNFFLICDASGVYMLTLGTDGRLHAFWGFRQTDYDAMNAGVNGVTGRIDGAVSPDVPPYENPRFVPTCVQRLADGNFLITNSFAGESTLFSSGRFTGEALEVTPPAFTVPPVGGIAGDTYFGGTFEGFSAPALVRGASTTNNTQVMGSAGTGNTTLVEQPRFAGRQ
jgi:hypothetical protein